MSPPSSLSKVALIVTVLSSLISLLCTALTISRPLLEVHLRRRRSKPTHSRSGNKNSNDPFPWQTNRMAPSPQPSQLTRPSGDTFFKWSHGTTMGRSEDKCPLARPLTMIQAVVDHISQLVFLAIIVSILLRTEKEEPLNLLRHRWTLFACAFVLTLRLLVPLSATLYTAASGFRKQQVTGTLFPILTLTALVLALLVAAFAIVASMIGSQSAACILLLCIVALCLALNTFVAFRLVIIQQRSSSGSIESSTRQQVKGKQAALDGTKEEYLASTMSTAGTKASSANPYDARCKSTLISGDVVEEKPSVEEEGNCNVEECKYSAATAANDSTEISSLWLNQSVPLQSMGDVPHTFHYGNFEDEVLLTPPPSASFRSLAPVSPPDDGMDRGGGRLRISPSAREIMVSISTPLDFYKPPLSLDMYAILLGLAGMWLTSILCIPLFVTSIVYSQPTLPTQIMTLLFIIGMAVTGPLIALQAFKNEKRMTLLPPAQRHSLSPLPRPSFASSLINGRTSKASNYSLSQECPIAGNGFEPVNGYDYPFSPYLPGSYESDKRVRSVVYASQHWTSGATVGDRVTASQGVFGRAANMMSPKPKLQVLSPGREGKSSSDSMASRRSSQIRFDEGYSQSSEAIVQDISENSAIMPGAMPLSPEQGENLYSSRSLHLDRRIDTIYEVATVKTQSTHTSEDGSPGVPRGASHFASSSFYRLTTALRKRRATLSEADWVNVSPSSVKGAGSNVDTRHHFIQNESASVSSHSLNVHRSSVSMSVVQHHTDWFQGEEHEMANIPDASCSDAELGELSVCSYFSMPPSEADGTATLNLSAVSLGKEEQDETTTAAKELEERAAEDEEVQNQEEQIECDSISRNWKVIGSPSIIESPPVMQGDVDMSIVSIRSFAGVMGFIEENDGCAVVSHSTPLRREIGLTSSNGKSNDAVRKSLCSEMGFKAASPGQGSSPCRSSSDMSSLHHRRMTTDTTSESFLSSGVDEELIISPDVTPERLGDGTREIIVVEMDESLPMDSESGDLATGQDEQGAEYAFSTHRYYQEGGNYLDPVEEVTEEPTIPILEHGDSDHWIYSDSLDEDKYGQSSYIDSPGSRPLQKVDNEKITSSTPVLSHNAAVEWAQLHGFATPSSFAYSPQSQFGWAEVIQTSKRTPQQSMQRRSRQSPYSSPHSIALSPLVRGRLESNLSAHTRAYLASRLGGTPSRLIGLQSKFWASSPPSLALDTQMLSQGKRRGNRGSLMIAMSPSAGFEEESSWVDGAIAEDEEHKAQQEMGKCAKKWKRKSKNVAGGEYALPHGSPVNVKSRSGRQRSSASLQSLIDAAVKRGSGAFRGSQQQSRVASSNRSSLASQMTLPSITISADGDDRASLGNRSDVKVVGSSTKSPPSTPRRRSSEEADNHASGKAPIKSGGTAKSRSVGRRQPDSPSSGKGKLTHQSPSPSPNRKSPAGRGKRASLGCKIDYKVHSRKDSRVRERVKMLEYSVRAVKPHPSTHSADVLQAISPRKKVQPRELTVLPASPGKFRLQEAATADHQDNQDDDKENVSAAPLLKRFNRNSRFNLRRPHPQIFVRPPSGSSTHTQHLY